MNIDSVSSNIVDSSVYNSVIQTPTDKSRTTKLDEFDEAAAQGGDILFNKLLLNCEYNDFILNLRKIIESENGSTYLEPEDKEKLNWTKEEFYKMKKEAQENYDELKKLFEEKKRREDEGVYDTPFRVILNGNFDKLDKTKLNDNQKRQFNVDGLPDECYDIFFDKKCNRCTTVYYDFLTENTSFLEFTKLMHSIQKTLGNNMNWKTPLMLFDRDLMGVNCQSDNLPPYLAKKVWEEAKINPYFHFREIAMNINDKTGDLSRFEINIANWSVIWIYTQCFNLYHEAPRQTGKTFIVTHILAYEYVICGYNGKKILFGHYNFKQAVMNREKMIQVANCYPKYLRFHAMTWEQNKKRQGWRADDLEVKPKAGAQTTNHFLKTVAKAISVGKSLQSAEQAGRGETSPFPYIDELNFITYIQAVTTSLNYTYSTARTKALNANKRACMFWTSTAGKLNTKHGREMYDVITNQMCHFELEYFSFSFNKLEDTLIKGSSRRFFNIKYDYETMGLDNNWFSYMKSLAESSNAFRTEVLQEWLDVDEDAIFTQEELIRIQRIASHNNDKAKLEFIFSSFPIKYFQSIPGISFNDAVKEWKTLGIGVDMGHGQRNDYTTIYGIDLETGEPRFIFKNNNILMVDFVSFFQILVRRILEANPKILMTIIFEVDGPGQDVLPSFIRDPIIEPYLFRYIVPIDPKKRDLAIKSYSRAISDDMVLYYGALPMKTIRDYMFNELLMNIVQNYPRMFGCIEMYEEVVTLGRNTKGKIAAKPGAHDDMVAAGLHVLAMLFYPKYRESLEKYFNFIVDYTKMKPDPIGTKSIFYEEEKKFVDREGELTFTINKHRDEFNEPYETITVYRIINGIKTEVPENDYKKDIQNNRDLFLAIRNLKHKKTRINLTSLAMQTTDIEVASNIIDNRTIYSDHSKMDYITSSYGSYNKDRDRNLSGNERGYVNMRKERLF